MDRMKAVVHKYLTTIGDRDVLVCGERPWAIVTTNWRYVTCARCRREKPRQGKRGE